jgi:hypothetical protein
MPPTSFAFTSALLGGFLWVLQWLVGPGDDALGLTLHWGGLALVLLATAVGATRLVTGDVVALRALVAVAAPLLAWSVVDFFRPADAAGWYHGGWGVVALAVGACGLARGLQGLLPASGASGGAHAR